MTHDSYIGRQVGDFFIRERIGIGGMATVYRAYQPSVNRDVALKLLHLQDASRRTTTFQRRFTQEAELIAALEHIHILPVYDYGLSGDVAFLAMRLLRGGSLSDLLKDGQPLETDRAADIFRQITRGLAYAHRKGVIHRDLKPSNIMFDDEGNALLTDFGLAKIVGGPDEFTQSGTVVGTPLYMSPEQLRGELLDHRSDIYSLGVILYEMLTGRTPFRSDNDEMISLIYQQIEKQPPPPREINPDISPDVEALILRALAKRPLDRVSEADAFCDDLYLALGRHVSSSGSQPRLSTGTPTTRVHSEVSDDWRGQRWLVYSSVAAALLAVGALILLLLGGYDSGASSSPDAEIAFVPTVIVGAEGVVSDVQPSQADVARARQHLGDNGFIAYVTCTQETAYHATQTREMREMADAYALDLRIYNSDTDEYRQLTLIEQARADGAEGLIVCPLAPALIAEALEAVQRAGLPLVLLQSNMPSYGGVLLAGDDHNMGYRAGHFAGEIIAQEYDGAARVIILDFPDMPSIVERADGIEAGVLGAAPSATIVGRWRGGTREFGAESMRALLADDVGFDVMVSINDAGALGAIDELNAAGIGPDEVVVVGIDAETLARNYITRGYYMRGSVQIDREGFSRAAIDSMVKLLAGAELPETIVVPPGDVATRATLADAVPPLPAAP